MTPLDRLAAVIAEISDVDELGMVVLRNVAPLLLQVAKDAQALEPSCTNPVADSEGDGEWSAPVWRDCGECPDCVLLESLAVLDAAIAKDIP